MRLSLRLVLAFVAVAAVAVGTAALVVGLTTASRFERFASDVRHHEAEHTADRLAAAYERTGDLRKAARDVFPRGQPRGLPLAVVDAEGEVVWGPGGIRSRMAIAAWPATPLVVAGREIGQLHMPQALGPAGPLPIGSDARAVLERAFINETVRSLLIGLAIAVGVALGVGVVIAAGITRPLRRLTAAARGVAAGDLRARSGLAGRDEVATVGAAFDDMAAGLQAQEAARRNLFADIAHELRTPVTVIEGNLQAMLDGVYDRSDETLRSTLNRAEGLHRLVEDIRDLSLADVGKLDLSLEQVALGSRARRRGLGDAEPGAGEGRGARVDAVASGRGIGRRIPAAPGSGQSAGQRGAPHAVERLDRHPLGHPGRRDLLDRGDGYGRGHPRRGPAAHIRPVLPRHRRLWPQDPRQRARTGDRAGADRPPWTAQLTATSTPGEGSTFRIELAAAD